MHSRTLSLSLPVCTLVALGGLVTVACGDDDSPVTLDADAGADAAASSATSDSTSSPTESTLTASDAGHAQGCSAILTACAGKDDEDGLGNLCLRVGDGGDAQSCGVLQDSCLTYCETGEVPQSEGGSPTIQECKDMGEACHDYDQGPGLGRLCHDVGHKANLAWCAPLYDSCAALCQLDALDGGAGHGHDEDAGEQSHGDLDASSDAGDALEPLTLEFAAKVGDRAFGCGETYTNVGSAGSTVTPMDLRLYVSNVRLLTPNGDEVPFIIDDVAPFQATAVALLDFEDGSGECRNGNAALNTSIRGKAPRGNYVGLAFSTSVPVELNHQDPLDLPAPLQPSDMTWGWLFGYKFVKAELVQVLDAAASDGGTDAGSPMAGSGIFHLGSTACQNLADAASDMQVECANPNRNDVVLNDFDPSSSTVVLDVARLFEDADLSSMVMCHSSGSACAPMFTSMGVDLASGGATDGQTAFSVQ